MRDTDNSQLNEALSRHLERQADLATKIPPMVLLYPIDQGYLKSMIVRRVWMLKLCCMAPGAEHILDDNNEGREGVTRPDLGWYCLKDFGRVTGPIFRWAKKHEAAIKLLPKVATLLESFEKDNVTKILKTAGKTTSELPVPESHLLSNAGTTLPDSAPLRLVGIRKSDYRVLHGQGLVFLQRVFERYEPCGNLSLYSENDSVLWLCHHHLEEMKKTRAAQETIRRDELLTRYLQKVESQVSSVRILGDSVPRKLEEVFVDLTVTVDPKWPSSETQAEYMGLMDAELRRRRNPLSREYGEGQERLRKGHTVQPEVLLQDHRRAIIVGAPGSGKSTMLRYLAYKTLQETESLPVFLELKTIQKTTFDSAEGKFTNLVFLVGIDRLVCQSESDRGAMRKEFLERLKKGQVSIFLDGLDEVSGKEFFTSLRLSVREFLQDSDYQNARLFISTRPYAFKDRFSRDEAEEMEIEPFNQEQIERFVGHYYPGEPEANKLLVELKRRPELRELARVPALLGFLLLLYRKHRGAPENRIGLYDEVVHELVSQWDEEKGVERAFQTTEGRRRDFLSHMAFGRLLNLQQQPLPHSLVFSSQEILDEAERYCQSKRISNQADLLAEDVKATPLLSQIGTDSYAFAHLTIQEYLAATVLSKHEDCAKYFCRAYFDPTLSELEILPMTLVMAANDKGLFKVLGGLSESLDFKKLRLQARSLRYGSVPENVLTGLAEVLKQMVTGEEVEFGYFAAIVKSFRGASSHAAETIARVVADELNNDAAVYRSYAVRILGFLENETATRLLHRALEDSDGSVRVEAALFICVNDNGSAVESLIGELKSEDTELKEEVVYALWQIGTERAIEGLKKALEDEDKFIRKLSLEALSSLTGATAIPILIDHLEDSDAWVRRIVVTELGELGGENVLDALMKATDDPDSYVAEESLEWLGRSPSQRVVDFLLGFLDNHSGKIIGPAAEALGRAKDVKAIPKLYELLEKYKSDDTKKEPLSYLLGGWINGYVRVRAAAALVQLGDERGKPVLLEALSSGETGERKYAAYALKKFGAGEMTPLLLQAFKDARDDDEQIALANVLLSLEMNDLEPIVQAMNSIVDSRRGYRDSRITGAINVLGRTGGKAAVQGLTKALENSDPTAQIAAIVALGNIAAEAEAELAVEGLLKKLKGFNVVSEEAARVLASMNSSILARGLFLCLQSDWKYVRRKAAESIAYYTSGEAIEAELSSLAENDPAPRVKSVAAEALSQIQVRRWSST